MILFSPDAVEDVERLRNFLDQKNPDAARRALAVIWTAIDRLQEFPYLGMSTKDADIRASEMLRPKPATNNPTGKSAKTVQPRHEKYSA
jgi:plasmid stabilization system protein ParE